MYTREGAHDRNLEAGPEAETMEEWLIFSGWFSCLSNIVQVHVYTNDITHGRPTAWLFGVLGIEMAHRGGSIPP